MMSRMHRTQLLLHDWQYQGLKSLAEERGCSLSALVRDIVGQHLRRRDRQRNERLARIEGVAEGPPDLGRAHDKYLYGTDDADDEGTR
jgi:predicted DNA-binding ribbon-helix-helix protein